MLRDGARSLAVFGIPFRTCLVCHSIGVRATQLEAIELAHHYGFGAVGAETDAFLALTTSELDAVAVDVASRGLIFGAASLPVEFRQTEEEFQADLERLPIAAAAFRRVGGDRFWTWLAPCHDELPFDLHFDLHVRRLGRVTEVLRTEGLRLGLEYQAPQTLRDGWSHPFIHTLNQTQSLIEAIGSSVLGLVLDSFHWHAAGESVEAILALPIESVIAVDLSDAPTGVPAEELRDDARELPAATGVIDTAGFLRAAAARAVDRTPIRAEPFNVRLNALSKQEALAEVATVLHRILAPLSGVK